MRLSEADNESTAEDARKTFGSLASSNIATSRSLPCMPKPKPF